MFFFWLSDIFWLGLCCYNVASMGGFTMTILHFCCYLKKESVSTIDIQNPTHSVSESAVLLTYGVEKS